MRTFAVSLLVFVLFFGLLEGGSRLYEGWKGSRDDAPAQSAGPLDAAKALAKYDPELGYTLNQGDNADPNLFVDSRGRRFARKKPKNTYRIVCLGGSTTYGVGSKPGLGYPELLQRLFELTGRDRPVKVEVINAGVMGYHSWHSLIRSRVELDVLQPDLYLLMDGLNDILASQNPKILQQRMDKKTALLALVNANPPGPLHALNTFLMHSSFYRTMHRLADSLARPHPTGQDVPQAPAETYLERIERFGYRDNIKKFMELRKAQGIAVVLVNHPWIVGPGENVQQARARLPYDVDPCFVFGRTYVSQTDQDLARKEDAPLVDPQPALDALSAKEPNIFRVFVDAQHYTPLGNLALARSVQTGLCGMDWFRKALGGDCASLSDQAFASAFRPILNHGRCMLDYGWPKDLSRALASEIVSTTDLKKVDQAFGAWGFYAPAPGKPAGRLVVRVTPTAGFHNAVFYPRLVALGDEVRVVSRSSDKTTVVFRLKETDKNLFPEISQAYGLRLPDSAGAPVTLEVELTGQAELYFQKERLFFFDALHEKADLRGCAQEPEPDGAPHSTR
ncbi:SGNH/GDSL hydrolase family protein [Fundidesulfovibrio butyratiphilus]